MENWDKHTRDHRKQHHRENPSFSSTLLDAIYRSIDEGQQQQQQQTEEKQQENKLIFYRETMRKQKQQKDNNREDCEASAASAEKPSSRRARKVEIWMDKKASEKVLTGRNSLTEFDRRTRSNSVNALSMYSSSTSSESSSAGGFSSSESESFIGVHRPKPIRTSLTEKNTATENHKNHLPHAQTQKPKHENNNGMGKTKSKALRILYGDLKKSKQPISPGARLASFLNSLFNNAKKAKVSSPVAAQHEVSNSVQGVSSTCSSASSFSRSCLSKTPSSRTGGGAKRSVRFCPVSVIVDEDCRPCGHKNLHEEGLQKKGGHGYGYGKSTSSDEELRLHVLQESRRVEELARDLLKNYQKKNEQDFDMMQYDDDDDEDDDDDDDDGASCSSSDLFELDNLSAIGIERYREELPVYETTHFNTNRAIANGFIL